jgi:amino acid transporter
VSIGVSHYVYHVDNILGSFDCAVSLSEEASNAAIAVPQAIVGAIGSAGLLGTVILLILALTMGCAMFRPRENTH